MFESALFQWVGTIIASGGIGAAITYIATFKSNKRKAAAEAKKYEELAQQSHIESMDSLGKMERDRYEAMYNQINKMMQDYNDLSDDYREYRKDATERERAFIRKAQNNYSILAELKSEVNLLRKYSCYNIECPHRIKDNTDIELKEE